MKNITVATKKNVGYYRILVESCKRNNIDLIVLGLGQEWKGFTMRFDLWMNYLNTLNDNEIVMINDAYDVVILQNSKIILNKFLKFNKKIVFSCENELQHNFVPHKCFNYNINMGNIIGYVYYIKKFINIFYKYQHLWNKFNNDDMLLINYICRFEKDFFNNYCAIDTKEDIFFITNGIPPFYNMKELIMDNNKLKNTRYNNYPSVLHMINTNAKKYLNYIGYDTNDIKITSSLFSFEPYKINQFFFLLINNKFMLSLYFIIFIIFIYISYKLFLIIKNISKF